MFRRSLIAAAAALALAWPLAAQDARPLAGRPQFRAGVEIMRVEVTVLDKRTRKPVRGLTAGAFAIKVNGRRQEIVGFAENTIPGVNRAAPAWTREAAIDVASNRRPPTTDAERLIVIVLDDALTATHASGRGVDLYHRVIGKKAAHRVVDELGPNDRAAVVFAQANQHAQDFTADRTLLRKAIETYNPLPVHPWLANKMSTGTLIRAGEYLAGIPDRRRAIFYMTVGPVPNGTDADDPLDWNRDVMQQRDVEALEGESAIAGAMRKVVQTTRIAQVPIYPISTLGLDAPGPGEIRGGAARSQFPNEVLRTIAQASGGRAIVNNNAPDQVVADVFEELSSSYLLAYEATFPLDGKHRRLEVAVNHPGAFVEPDGLVIATPKAAVTPAPAGAAGVRSSGLLEAIASPLDGGALPLDLVTMPAANAASETGATLVMTLGVSVPGAEADEIEIETRIFDGEGRVQVTESRQTVRLAAGGDRTAPYEIALRADVKPGRYNVRIGASIPGADLSGGVFATVVVPDFMKAPLSLSGVAMGLANARPVGGREVLDGLLPFAPSTARTFSSADVVGALVMVHQAAGQVDDVTVESTLANERGEVVLRQSKSYVARVGSEARGSRVEHRFELPLVNLAAGNYLLAFTATGAKGATAVGEVRFTRR